MTENDHITSALLAEVIIIIIIIIIIITDLYSAFRSEDTEALEISPPRFIWNKRSK